MSKQSSKHPLGFMDKISHAWVIIILCIVLILIPLTIIGVKIYDQYQGAGKPIHGARYENDLPNKISKEQVMILKEQLLASVSEIEELEVSLQSAVLKVSVDVKDDTGAYGDVARAVYAKVAELLPIETYFTSSETVKNYDLEINVVKGFNDTSVHIIYVKNAQMKEPVMENVNVPKNEPTALELTKELNGENEPKPSEGENQ